MAAVVARVSSGICCGARCRIGGRTRSRVCRRRWGRIGGRTRGRIGGRTRGRIGGRRCCRRCGRHYSRLTRVTQCLVQLRCRMVEVRARLRIALRTLARVLITCRRDAHSAGCAFAVTPAVVRVCISARMMRRCGSRRRCRHCSRRIGRCCGRCCARRIGRCCTRRCGRCCARSTTRC